MNTKENAQVLGINELEQVAGGSVGELGDLMNALMGKGLLGAFGEGEMHIPGFNKLAKDEITKVLYTNYGIMANISIGFAGLGIGSDANMYKDARTGRALSHKEVLAYISG